VVGRVLIVVGYSGQASELLDYLSTRDAMPVGCPKTKFPKSPRLVRRLGHHESASSGHIPVELIHIVDVQYANYEWSPSSLAGLSFEHSPSMTLKLSRQKAPSLSINRVLAEAQGAL
jgi:hypothetical protein